MLTFMLMSILYRHSKNNFSYVLSKTIIKVSKSKNLFENSHLNDAGNASGMPINVCHPTVSTRS